MSLLLGALADLATAFINNNTQTTISNNQRRVEQTKIIATAVVGVAAVAGAVYVGKKAIENADVMQIQTPIGPVMLKGKPNTNMLPQGQSVSNPKMISGGIPTVTIDTDSVWIDRDDNTFGGNLINANTGASMEFVYHMEDVGNNKHQIYESVNDSDWQLAGEVDWNNMNVNDLDKVVSDGPIFSEMLKIANSK